MSINGLCKRGGGGQGGKKRGLGRKAGGRLRNRVQNGVLKVLEGTR